MACTSEATKRGLHNRYHVRKGILKADCPLCQLAAQAAGTPMPAVPDPPSSLRQAEKRLEITSRLAEEDAKGKLTGVSARGRTIEQAAIIFGMTTEEFAKEFEIGFKGITWAQFAERAAVVQLDEVERAIWTGAKSGDVRFVQLLILTGRLQGWVPGTELSQFPTSMKTVRGIHEVTPPSDLSTMSIEELQLKRKQLEAVIDRPTTAERIQALQSPTLTLEDTKEAPEGWVRVAADKFVAKGCEESNKLSMQESGI
jgi:hypothetical protein